MSQPRFAVTVSRTVPASPTSLYDLVADVTRIGEHSPETVSARWLDDRGPAAEPGRRFTFEEHLRAGMTATLAGFAAAATAVVAS